MKKNLWFLPFSSHDNTSLSLNKADFCLHKKIQTGRFQPASWVVGVDVHEHQRVAQQQILWVCASVLGLTKTSYLLPSASNSPKLLEQRTCVCVCVGVGGNLMR